MLRLIKWAGRNLDAAVALVLAFVLGVLGLANVATPFVVESATLVVLALLAEVVLREQFRRTQVEDDIREGVRSIGAVMEKVAAPMAELTGTGEVVTSARAALERLSLVRVLDRAGIRDSLNEAWHVTDRWHFKGGTGAYIRAATLPECIRNTQRRRGRLEVRLEILDPTNEAACERYARLKAALVDERRHEGWSLDKTRKELFATILAACWYQQRYTLLDIEVRLSPVMTTFRWDLSSTWIMVTEQDPNAPALLFEKDSFYYDRWRTELVASLEQARPIPIGSDRRVELSDRPTVDEIRRLFEGLGISLPRSFTDRDVTDIALRALEPRNAYP